MTENKNIVKTVDKTSPVKSFFCKVWAAIKEWGRKQIVGLKNSPQKIYLFVSVITTFLWLIWLFSFSHTISITSQAEWTGIAVFCTTLLSILVLALYFSAFPKRSKPKTVFVVLLFVFIILQILFDVLYYVQETNYVYAQTNYESYMERNPFIQESFNYAIAHIVLNGLCMILLATMPLYKKLIMKINTRKEVVSTEIKEEIDTSEEV